MPEIEEFDLADDEIRSVEVSPCDIGELIKDSESQVRMGLCGKSIKEAATQECPIKGSEHGSHLVSVFNPANYPSPWPLIPFSAPTPKLEKRIPFHLLPQKLVVHDPWNLLSVNLMRRKDKDGMEWTSKDDVVRIYRLQLSATGTKTVEKEKKLQAELVAKCQDIGQREGIIYVPSDKTSTSPAIMAFPPLRPPPPESVPEAHLYLSPAHQVGVGNHSVAYNAEWELPRSMLVKEKLCQDCMKDQIAEDLKQQKKCGKYHYVGVKKKAKVQDGSESVLREASPSTATFDPKSAKVTITDGQLPGVSAKFIPARAFESKKIDGNDRRGEDKKGPEVHAISPRTYKGPIVKVFPEVDWQNPERGPYCPHIQESMGCEKVPLTAKVSAVAKLSKRYDDHLGREANNYQSFPAHLFEHRKDSNVIPPLHDPVPGGAVVPQFYGYYVPEENEGDKYLSPILLLENCGVPIVVEALDEYDKHHCTSLLLRMHEAGWTHGDCEFNL